ncbi:MAG: hypothetical protein IT423_15215 [Pirellulaceae bacterium]|nr:hypothetical protein [Pirellulaceae bacterium]
MKCPRRTTNQALAGLCLALIACSCCSVVRADEFLLKDGRRIVGTVKSTKDKVLVIELSPGTMLLLNQSEVKQHIRPTSAEQAYAESMKSGADTVEFHLEQAATSQKNGLKDYAEAHYQRVLELDSENRIARSSMGYTKGDDGRWIKRNELMTEGRGKVSIGGNKYRFQELIDIQAAEEKANTQRVQMANDIRRAIQNLNNPRLAADAMTKLQTLDGPMASAAIAEVLFPKANALRKDTLSVELKLMFVATLERLADAAAVQTLIRLSLAEPNASDINAVRGWESLRTKCIDALKQIDPHSSAIAFMGALKSDDPAAINTAARALEDLGDSRAILPLIEHVVTFHRRQISGGGNSTNVGFGSGGFSFGNDPVKMGNLPSENAAVQRALVTLTSQDYGYDKRAWLAWYHQQFVSYTGDLRRD